MAAKPWPAHTQPEIITSRAIALECSGVGKSQIAGTPEMPKEQKTSPGDTEGRAWAAGRHD